MSKYQYSIEYFEQFPLIIKLLWIIIVFFVITVLVLISYLKMLRSYLRKEWGKTTKYEKEYELVLLTYLFSGNEVDEVSPKQQLIIDQLKDSSKDKLKRKILVSLLMKLNKSISGEMSESIKRLYSQTGLIGYGIAQLKSNQWHVIAKGIRELSEFQSIEVYNEVFNIRNHVNREIRKEVQLYLVSLFNFKGLVFLDDLKTFLSEWDQIKLLEELHRGETQVIPNITSWLRSENESVVFFALKLAKIYNQFEVKNTLIDLLLHKNKKVRIQVILILGHLHVVESKEVLKRNFNQSSQEEQVVFFKIFEDFYDNNDESFLLEHIRHKNFDIKLRALSMLKKFSIDAFKSIEILPTDIAYAKIFKFVENN
jgi:hypothetical protein